MKNHSARDAIVVTVALAALVALISIVFGPRIIGDGITSWSLGNVVALLGAGAVGVATVAQGVKAISDLLRERNGETEPRQEEANRNNAEPPNPPPPDRPPFEDPTSLSAAVINESAPRIPFVGPVPLRSADQCIFFGRQQHVETLVSRLVRQAMPVVVVHGPSGAGKTSLIRAGLIPALRERDYIPIYTRILTHPRSDVLYDIKQSVAGVSQAHDIPQALDCARSNASGPVRFALIIDQFENCFHLARESVEWQAFWYDMAHVLRGGAQPLAQVVFSIRGDWLFAFQRVNPEIFDAPPLNFAVLVDLFDEAQAAAALRGPFEQFGVTLRPGLVESIVNDLVTSDGRINPPQLQIVGAALYDLAVAANPDKPELSLEDYQSLNGARSIIGRHLEGTMRGLAVSLTSPAWQILMRLAGPGNKRLPVREGDLRRLAPAEFDYVMPHLVKARLAVRLMSSDTEAAYILTHDYLASTIVEQVANNLELRNLKIALNYIDAGMTDWMQSKESRKNEVLLDASRYAHIYSQRDQLRALTDDIGEFLIRNALAHGAAGLGFWLKHLSPQKLDSCLRTVATSCADPRASVRVKARAALETDLKDGTFEEEHCAKLYALIGAAQAAGQPGDRLSAGRIRWWLRRKAAWNELPSLAAFASLDWLRQHRSPVLTAVGATVIFIGLAGAGWAYTLYKQGRWERLPPLFAGHVAAAAFTEDEIFIAVPRGLEEKDTWTLLRHKPGGDWRVISRNVAKLPISAVAVTQVGGQERILLSVRGIGLLASDDGGSSWRTANTGLSSYAIVALEPDRAQPSVIFAGSNDMKGAYRSDDGGLTWQSISGSELFGTSVLALHDLPGPHGRLLAGTDDGRIEAYDLQTGEWELVSAYPGSGAVLALAGDPQDGKRVYAGTRRGQLFRSDDAGSNWEIIERPLNVLAVWSLTVEPGAPDSAFMSAYGIGGTRVWHTSDGGASWSPVPNDQFTRQGMTVRWLADSLIASGEAGLFESADRGVTWRYAEMTAPIGIVQGLAIGATPAHRVYANLGGSVFTLDDNRRRWVRGANLPSLDVRSIAPHPLDPDIAYAGLYVPGQWGLYRTRDGGATWERTGIPTGFEERVLNDVTAVALWSGQGRTLLYAGTAGCGVFRSDDGGGSWVTTSLPDCQTPEAPNTLIDLAADPGDDAVVYATADNTKVYVSRDSGATWSMTDLPLRGQIGALEVDPVAAGRAYLIAGADGFWRSDDAGQKWLQMPGLEGKTLVALTVNSVSQGVVVVATSDGEMLKTEDAGQSWSPIPRNPNILAASALAQTDGRGTLLVGNALGGVWRFLPDTIAR